MTAKKDSRNRGFEEKAHLNIDQQAYEEGYERIFGNKESAKVPEERLPDYSIYGGPNAKVEMTKDWSRIAIDIQAEFNQYREQARQDILALVMMIDQGFIPPALYADIKERNL
jgi:hypothetical protein